MTATSRSRRVVTGLNDQGQSCVIIDGPVQRHGQPASLIWRSASVPADNTGRKDTSAHYTMDMLHDGGSNFMLVELPPGMSRFMHATDTLDYLVVLSGQVTLELEAVEVTLSSGDFIVDRGVNHAWRNDGPDVASQASAISLRVVPPRLVYGVSPMPMMAVQSRNAHAITSDLPQYPAIGCHPNVDRLSQAPRRLASKSKQVAPHHERRYY
jgi:quercetin dioxygenase-like cupin family protein